MSETMKNLNAAHFWTHWVEFRESLMRVESNGFLYDVSLFIAHLCCCPQSRVALTQQPVCSRRLCVPDPPCVSWNSDCATRPPQSRARVLSLPAPPRRSLCVSSPGSLCHHTSVLLLPGPLFLPVWKQPLFFWLAVRLGYSLRIVWLI